MGVSAVTHTLEVERAAQPESGPDGANVLATQNASIPCVAPLLLPLEAELHGVDLIALEGEREDRAALARCYGEDDIVGVETHVVAVWPGVGLVP